MGSFMIDCGCFFCDSCYQIYCIKFQGINYSLDPNELFEEQNCTEQNPNKLNRALSFARQKRKYQILQRENQELKAKCQDLKNQNSRLMQQNGNMRGRNENYQNQNMNLNNNNLRPQIDDRSVSSIPIILPQTNLNQKGDPLRNLTNQYGIKNRGEGQHEIESNKLSSSSKNAHYMGGVMGRPTNLRDSRQIPNLMSQDNMMNRSVANKSRAPRNGQQNYNDKSRVNSAPSLMNGMQMRTTTNNDSFEYYRNDLGRVNQKRTYNQLVNPGGIRNVPNTLGINLMARKL
ncbi:UNKNOWN [Stylonychia lemnae]|uniref:Uncharacterized protein n=1 Tax=Stylonychia lemnae TaxID=5949 RepID=A0A078A0U3_STYLE|nr:UNKNOWN [Stylonychia lemnae]|eukprot:CDW75088.1 UNKNOWN [Stylonychia lemnae]